MGCSLHYSVEVENIGCSCWLAEAGRSCCRQAVAGIGELVVGTEVEVGKELAEVGMELAEVDRGQVGEQQVEVLEVPWGCHLLRP